MSDEQVPLCVYCRTRECTYDSEPPNPGYFSTCSACMSLIGYDPQGTGTHHVHEHTASTLAPVFEGGTLTGWTCRGRYAGGPCGYVQPLIARYVARPYRRPFTDWYVYDLQEADTVTGPNDGGMDEGGARAWAALLNEA